MINFTKKITFIIVSTHSENVIWKCLNCLPKNSKIIIVENSKNKNVLKHFKKKRDINLILNSKNVGYGAGNNIGLKKTKTKYAFIINPDVVLKAKIFKKIENSVKNLNNNFWLLGLDNLTKKENHLEECKTVNGHAIMVNLQKFKNKKIFDENFFLYNEEIDLCINVAKKGGKIYSLETNDLTHSSGTSWGKDDFKKKVFRNWHGYWSYIYFYKKNYGNLKAYSVFLKRLIGALIQLFFGIIFFNRKKRIMNKFKSLALLTVIMGKPAYLRLDDLNFN